MARLWLLRIVAASLGLLLEPGTARADDIGPVIPEDGTSSPSRLELPGASNDEVLSSVVVDAVAIRGQLLPDDGDGATGKAPPRAQADLEIPGDAVGDQAEQEESPAADPDTGTDDQVESSSLGETQDGTEADKSRSLEALDSPAVPVPPVEMPDADPADDAEDHSELGVIDDAVPGELDEEPLEADIHDLTFDEWKELELHGEIVNIPRQLRRDDEYIINYASRDCGAQVMDANADAKNVAAVLSKDKDTYLLNPCTAKAFLVIELCSEVRLHKIEFANLELFSSTFAAVRLLISEKYPVREGEWVHVETFETEDSRQLQTKILTEPTQKFTKYLRIEFTKTKGAEHYCPLSLFRVFGVTQLEEFNELQKQQADADAAADEPEKLKEDPVATNQLEGVDSSTAGRSRVSGVLWGLANRASRVLEHFGLASGGDNDTDERGMLRANESKVDVSDGVPAGVGEVGALSAAPTKDEPVEGDPVQVQGSETHPRAEEKELEQTSNSSAVAAGDGIEAGSLMLAADASNESATQQPPPPGEATEQGEVQEVLADQAVEIAHQESPSATASIDRQTANGAVSANSGAKDNAPVVSLAHVEDENTHGEGTASSSEHLSRSEALSSSPPSSSSSKSCFWAECLSLVDNNESFACPATHRRSVHRRWDRPFSAFACGSALRSRELLAAASAVVDGLSQKASHEDGTHHAHIQDQEIKSEVAHDQGLTNTSASNASSSPLSGRKAEKLKAPKALVGPAVPPADKPMKGSIFSQLSSKIKILERNMSLSERYLEKMRTSYAQINSTLSQDILTVRRELKRMHELSEGASVATAKSEADSESNHFLLTTLLEVTIGMSRAINELQSVKRTHTMSLGPWLLYGDPQTLLVGLLAAVCIVSTLVTSLIFVLGLSRTRPSDRNEAEIKNLSAHLTVCKKHAALRQKVAEGRQAGDAGDDPIVQYTAAAATAPTFAVVERAFAEHSSGNQNFHQKLADGAVNLTTVASASGPRDKGDCFVPGRARRESI